MFQQGGEPICLIVCTFWNMKNVGLFLPWCSDRIVNVLARAGWKCTPAPRSTSSQATIYTHCTSHSTEALACPNLPLWPAAHSGWRCRWLCHPVPVQAVSPGSVLPLLPLASVCLTWSQSLLHPLKLAASFDSVFSFTYQWSYPTQSLPLQMVTTDMSPKFSPTFFLLNPSLVLIWWL